MTIDLKIYLYKTLTTDDIINIKNILSGEYVMWKEDGDLSVHYAFIKNVNIERDVIYININHIIIFDDVDEYRFYKNDKISLNDIYNTENNHIEIIDKQSFTNVIERCIEKIKNKCNE